MPALRLAFFASHNGSAMRAISAAIQAGHLNAEVSFVASNNADASALSWAHEHGLTTHHLSARKLGSPAKLEQETLRLLRQSATTHIVLSGYMRKLSEGVLKAYRHHILNVHPSLLPAFGGQGMYGDHVHRAVLESGIRESGATIHCVTENYDEGPILSQMTCIVRENDTLASLKTRIAKIEAALYIETLQQIASDETDQ